MACGTPVVCTDAHGNRDFCVDGVNCLMPPATPRAVGEALARLLSDGELRDSLAREGLRTAREFAWERRIDAPRGILRAGREHPPDGARRRAGGYRSSAIRGASRLKYQKPSTNVPHTIAIGASSHSQLPIT